MNGPSSRSWQPVQTNGTFVFVACTLIHYRPKQKWLAQFAASHPNLRSRHLCRERAAAAAVPCRIGILENESLPHQRLFVLERRSAQVQEALRIDEDARAKLLENLVAVARLRI